MINLDCALSLMTNVVSKLPMIKYFNKQKQHIKISPITGKRCMHETLYLVASSYLFCF